ncbi:hypothetical protein [Cerasicoccus fimbriatus]|uniref:hypothetical protein n=1 Tax=Cerasicoccus fimbriatus TaxID=3014554 RepID=UPI0022B330CB|nr:hypothetical protein [Cerasicoccus sp. TK19100]
MADETTEATTVEEIGLIDDLAPATPPAEVSAWWFIGPAIVVIALAAIIWQMRARIRAKIEQLTAPPPPNPAKDAREALAELRAAMSELTMREFIDRLSKIFRAYLEGRFTIRATSQTTREFLKAATKGSRFNEETREKIREFLETSDRAKFAHQTVPEETGNAFLAFVESYIEATEKSPPAKEDSR